MSPVEIIWRDYQRGLCTHQEALRFTRNLNPRCRYGLPSVARWDDEPVCEVCVALRAGVALPSGNNREVVRP